MFWSKKKSIIEQIREREAKEKEWEDIPVVGARSPEQKAEIEAKRIESANEKELEQPRKEREKEEKAEDGLKLVIDTAKLECKLCSNPQGLMKVNYDTPTIQEKKTATVKEKSPQSLVFMGTCSKSPQSSSPCASVMQLGEWKDIGTSKSQDERVLLQKSTIKCNYGSIDVKITDSGQINEPENITTTGAPVPENVDDNTEYIYYSKEGLYLGGIESSPKVYLSTQGEYDKAKKDKKWSLINKESNLLKENGKNITNTEFSNNAYLVHHEASLTGDKYTALWIAHTINNALNSKYSRGKKTFNQLFKTGYSSVKAADKMKTIKTGNKSQNEIYSRFAVINVLIGGSDPTGKSYFWDGLDLFTKKGELDHPKFKQYKSVTIYASHLKRAINFWNMTENKRKVNASATINNIYIKEYKLRKVTDGAIKYDSNFFVGARKDSQNNKNVSEDLVSTGFQSGTMFWTTYKGK